MTIIWHMVPEIWNATNKQNFLSYQKIQILKKLRKKKTQKNLIFIILQKCIKNQDHMLHCFWDTTSDSCGIYFLFWAIFCVFNPPHPPKLTTRKIIILKKWDIAWRSSFYIWVPKIIITWYTVPEIWCARDRKGDIIEVGAPPKNRYYQIHLHVKCCLTYSAYCWISYRI